MVGFEAVPQLGDAGCSEEWLSTPDNAASREARLADQLRDVGPLARFLELTSSDIPVPRLLMDLDDSTDEPDSGGRSILEVADLPDSQGGVIPVPPFPLAPPGHQYCIEGGDTTFDADFCQNIGINSCDLNIADPVSLTRSSGTSRRKISHSRVSSCKGTSSVWHL